MNESKTEKRASAHAIIRLPEVKEMTGLSKSTLYLRISLGHFPRPIQLGGRAVGWLEAEVQGWLEDQIALSRQTAQTPKA
jgi:prophage regulatory protein